DQRLPTMALPLSPIVAALHTDRHRRRPLLGVGQGIGRPAALLPGPEDVAAGGAARLLGRSSVTDHRHQERVSRRLEVADYRHAVEAAIQQDQPGPDADAGRLA